MLDCHARASWFSKTDLRSGYPLGHIRSILDWEMNGRLLLRPKIAYLSGWLCPLGYPTPLVPL